MESVPIRGFIAFPGAEDDRSDIPLPYVEGQSCDHGLALDHSRIRTDLQTAVKGLQGQERQDQIQLCRAQAHLDCLKQAIDQKIVGPERKDFVKNCAQ